MKIENKRILVGFCAAHLAMVSFPGRLDALSCSQGMSCDLMADVLGGTDHCPIGSTGPCNFIISDALVNCSQAAATCGNNGNTIDNVTSILFIGNCDGTGGCRATEYSRTVSPRCEKMTGAPCQLAKVGDVKLYSKR
jgi:hypothetical protein